MKYYLFFSLCVFFIACNNSGKETVQQESVTDKIKTDTFIFPYKPLYSSQFNNDVSDKDLLTVLNSYKFWENGLLVDLADLYADTVTYIPFNGKIYSGAKAGLLDNWTKERDTIKSIQIRVIAWNKVHEIIKGDNYVDVWYQKTEIFKSGQKQVAGFAERKQLVNGKIIFCSQYLQQVQ